MGVNLQNFKASLRTLFVTPSDLIDKPYDAFRVLLVVAILVVITSVLIGFTVFHLFISKLFDIAMINLMGIMVLVGLVYQVHLTKRVGWVGHVATVALLVFLPTFTAFNQNLDFGLIWLFFAPFVVVAFVGWRDAAIYLTLFYSVLLSMAFSAIGHWDSGNWSVLSFARLTVGLILGTALAMIVDVANSSMNRQIRLQRARS
ncbi:MAG: hypothetical protein JXK16_11975 [Thiotrichales bacterium]|nr:hypothetical protein [Thiotrichales bacterium]